MLTKSVVNLHYVCSSCVRVCVWVWVCVLGVVGDCVGVGINHLICCYVICYILRACTDADTHTHAQARTQELITIIILLYTKSNSHISLFTVLAYNNT